jgi:probable selenium-dependent hydroxylase accessory protein YqeC
MLLEAFGISHVERECIALVGAGGKTTTMFALARALKDTGRRVLVTTTTNVFMPQESQYDDIILSDAPADSLFENIRPGTITCLAGNVIEGKNKLKSVDPLFIDYLHEAALFDAVIVEADGARRMPIKAPAVYEPVIPKCTTLTIGCIGLDALGTPVDDDHVHRPQLLCEVTGAQPGEAVNAEHIVRLIGTKLTVVRSILTTS